MDKKEIAEDLYQLGILSHSIIDEGLKTGECKCILPNIGLYEKYGVYVNVILFGEAWNKTEELKSILIDLLTDE